jgi:hypothetical protein
MLSLTTLVPIYIVTSFSSLKAMLAKVLASCWFLFQLEFPTSCCNSSVLCWRTDGEGEWGQVACREWQAPLFHAYLSQDSVIAVFLCRTLASLACLLLGNLAPSLCPKWPWQVKERNQRLETRLVLARTGGTCVPRELPKRMDSS